VALSFRGRFALSRAGLIPRLCRRVSRSIEGRGICHSHGCKATDSLRHRQAYKVIERNSLAGCQRAGAISQCPRETQGESECVLCCGRTQCVLITTVMTSSHLPASYLQVTQRIRRSRVRRPVGTLTPVFGGSLVRPHTASRAPKPVEVKKPDGDVDGEACVFSERRVWMHLSSPHRGHPVVVFSQR